MRISELIPLLQPAVDPGVINAADNAATAGSSEFQAIIDQMSGPEESKAAETTVPPQTENPANPLPISMLVAELIFDGAFDEADQKLQNATCTPVVPMPGSAQIAAETAHDKKSPDESDDGKEAILGLAQVQTAVVINLPEPPALKISSETAGVTAVPSESAEAAAQVTSASPQTAIPMGIAVGMPPDCGAPAAPVPDTAEPIRATKSYQAGLAPGAPENRILPSAMTVSQAAAQPAAGIDPGGEAQIVEGSAGTDPRETGAPGEVQFSFVNAPSVSLTNGAMTPASAAPVKVQTSLTSSPEMGLPSVPEGAILVETIESEVGASNSTSGPAADVNPMEPLVAMSVSATTATGAPSGGSVAGSLQEIPPQPVVAGGPIHPEFPLPGSGAEPICAMPASVLQEPSLATPVPDAAPTMPGAELASKMPADTMPGLSAQVLDESQSQTEAIPLTSDSVEMVEATSLQPDRAPKDSVPDSSNKTISAVQEPTLPTKGSGQAIEPMAGVEAGPSKSPETSRTSPVSPPPAKAFESGSPSTDAQIQWTEQPAYAESLLSPGRQLRTHKADQNSIGMESLNLKSPVGSGPGIPGEILTAAQQQRLSAPNYEQSNANTLTAGMASPSLMQALGETQRKTESTADPAAKIPQAQGSHAGENPSPAAESAENKVSLSQNASGRTEEKTGGDVIKTPRLGPIDGKEIAHQEFTGATSPIDDKSAAMSKTAQPANPRPAEFVFDLAGKIQSMVKAGEGEVRIQLRPEHLGNIEIKAQNGAAGIVARIAAESTHVKQFLENNLHSLQQSLQEQGLKVERIDIVVQEGLDLRQAGTHQQQSGQAGNGQQEAHSNPNGGNARPTSSRFTDELLVDSVTAAVLGPNSTFHTIA